MKMNKKLTPMLMAGLLAVFIAGTAITAVVTPVYAAEQTTDQNQQNPPPDTQPGSNNEHSGHHG